MGVISWQNSFKTMGRIASGPAALETLRPERSLLTPAVEILMSCIIGNLHFRCSGRRLTREVAPFNIVVWQSFIRLRGDRMEKLIGIEHLGGLPDQHHWYIPYHPFSTVQYLGHLSLNFLGS